MSTEIGDAELLAMEREMRIHAEAEVERLRGALASIGAEAKLARDALLDERIVEARSCLNRIRELCDQDALEGGEK